MSKIKVMLITFLSMLMFSISAFAAESGVVNTDVLNFRSGAGTGYNLLGQFVRGEIVQVVEHVNSDWVKVSFNGRTGYVCTKYIVIREVPQTTNRNNALRPVSIEASGYVSTGSLNFRSQPEFADNVMYALPMYTQVWVIEDVGYGWGKIYYNNTAGYVSLEYITMGQAPQAPATISLGENIVNYAKKYLGKPYVYGGNGPNSFDCSGFTKYVFKNFGINIERTSYGQLNNGYYVSKDSLQPGDIVFFKQGGSVDHVGIYIGGGQMIHASSPGDVVKYDSIVSGYYNRYYYTARRVI